MGNFDSKSCNSSIQPKQRNKNPLRDDSVELQFPACISKPVTNLLLAFIDGNYFPCIIINRAINIPNGYLVYFLHSQQETEIPSCNVIGNFKALRNCCISFELNGQQNTGIVYDINTNEKNEATNFFISFSDKFAWISLPFIYLTVAQATQLL